MEKCFKRFWAGIAGMVLTALAVPIVAQDSSREIAKMDPGTKIETRGVIVERAADGFTLRDYSGKEFIVAVTEATRIREKKSNPFRGAQQYADRELVLGLHVRVTGVGDLSGRLIANRIRFTRNDLTVAKTIASRVEPVEAQLEQTNRRLEENRTKSQQEAELLSGEIEELDAAFRTVREETKQVQAEARAAQETADEAMAGVDSTNRRISALDEYDALKTSTVWFDFNSAELSEESRATLDELAAEAKLQKGFSLEVQGFASADGNPAYNLQLSQTRAESVVRYLVEKHAIPIRRTTTPMGYGEGNPAGSNATREGRKLNRRVEIRLLVSRGLTEPMDSQ